MLSIIYVLFDQDSSSIITREEVSEIPPSHDNSEDDESDEEGLLLAQAPTLHFSREKRINLLLLLATKKRHNLSYSASEDMMELAGLLSSDSTDFLPSRHVMKQAIEMYSSMTLTQHHVCPVCGTYVGIVTTSSCKCPKCNKKKLC